MGGFRGSRCLPMASTIRRNICWTCPKPQQKNSDSQGLAVRGSTLLSFTRVNTFSITLYDTTASPEAVGPFFQTLWTLGSRLQKLSVDVTPAQMPLILNHAAAAELPLLTNLEIRVSLSLLPVSSCTSRTVIQQTLLPFTQALRPTLTSLTIMTSQQISLARFFAGIGYLPHLRALNISIFMDEYDFYERPSLNAFLNAHGSCIQDLTIASVPAPSVYLTARNTYSGWLQRDFATLRLPAVRSLSVGLCTETSGLEEDLDWYMACAVNLGRLEKLESLIIPDAVFEYNLEKILSSLPLNGKGMRRLSLKVRSITLELLDILAARVPDLEELSLVSLWGMLNVSGCPLANQIVD
ncbi:hypothetical protein H0H81_000898 [Sphagnurus paluster]|uniref:Uncharacterized protein n=1 Tax=Sphagnurus paluster TaxID=117069 RepID=A0A9P7GHC9_9AGAR|nr:hypothetical protein H0H81_000898 [Sphagnurus paluster]